MVEYFMALVVALLFCWPFITTYRTKTRMCKMSLSWYLEKVLNETGNRSLICLKCGAEKINVERVFGGLYMRRHYCSRCGSTLYFSAEQ